MVEIFQVAGMFLRQSVAESKMNHMTDDFSFNVQK